MQNCLSESPCHGLSYLGCFASYFSGRQEDSSTAGCSFNEQTCFQARPEVLDCFSCWAWDDAQSSTDTTHLRPPQPTRSSTGLLPYLDVPHPIACSWLLTKPHHAHGWGCSLAGQGQLSAINLIQCLLSQYNLNAKPFCLQQQFYVCTETKEHRAGKNCGVPSSAALRL